MRNNGLLLVACVALAACGDPLRNVERLSDIETADAPAAAAMESPDAVTEVARAPGLLARLLGRGSRREDAAVEAAVAAALSVAPLDDVSGEGAIEVPQEGVIAEAPAPERRGFLGLFRARTTSEPDPSTAETTLETDAEGVVTLATAPAPAAGPDAQMVAPGEVVAFGEIARACDVSRRGLGTQVARTSGFRLYDTIPNSTAPRTHYITGFPDDCPRQFTAALAIFGDVGTHEVVRYQDHNDHMPYSVVDNAYEAIKAQVCRVAHGQPCGSRLERLGRDALFVTVYERFGNSPNWADILIYDGEVIAMDRTAMEQFED
ncbi:MAG: hypothetical protein ACI86S_002342 [Paracoccaceae bacterium]|jgi:hypothetical protein